MNTKAEQLMNENLTDQQVAAMSLDEIAQHRQVKSPSSAGSPVDKYTLAAIKTYESLTYKEESCIFIKHATILIAEVMRDEINAQDECEKFLREYAPEMLAAHYEDNVKGQPILTNDSK